jgi:hypothetical protein
MKLNQFVFITVLMILFICSTSVFSQSNILKEFSIQGLYCGITKTSDAGVAVVYKNQQSIYLVKMDSLLNIIWTKNLIIPNTVDPKNIITTTDGGFIISFNYIDGNLWTTLLVKTNSQGNVLWSFYYDRNWTTDPFGLIPTSTNGAFVLNNDLSFFEVDSLGGVSSCYTSQNFNYYLSASSIQKLNGDYYIYGVVTLANVGDEDLFVAKLNSAMQMEWTMIYDANHTTIYATSIREGLNNNLVFTGYIQGMSDTAFVLSVDLSGNLLWGKVYNDLGTYLFDIHADNSGYYYLGGMITDGAYQYSKDVLIKTDLNGSFVDAVCTGNSYASGFGLEYIEEIIDGYDNDFYVLSSNFVLKSTFEKYPLCYYNIPAYTDAIYDCTVIPEVITLNPVALTAVSVPVTDANSSLPVVDCHVGVAETSVSNSTHVNYISDSHLLEVSASKEIHQGSIDIFDLPGKKVNHYSLHDESAKTFSLSNLPTGIYFVLVQTDDELQSLKLVKQ